MNLEDRLRKCLYEVEEGLREIEPDDELASRHITKAKHNIRLASKLFDDSDNFLIQLGLDLEKFSPAIFDKLDSNTELVFYDWVISISYYAIYHSFLSALFTIGYTSKNHACVITAINYFFSKKMKKLENRTIKAVERIKTLDSKYIDGTWNAKERREEANYSPNIFIERILAKQTLEFARELRGELENLVDEIKKLPKNERINKLR